VPVWRLNEFGELVCSDESSHQHSRKGLPSSSSGRQPFATRDPNMVKAASTTTPCPKREKPHDINLEKIGKNALAAMTAEKKPGASNATNAFQIFEDTNTYSASIRNFNEKMPTQPNVSKSPRLTASLLEAQNQKPPTINVSPPTNTSETYSKVTSSLASNLPCLTEDLLSSRTRALSLHGSSSRSNKSIASSVHTNTASSVYTNFENDVDVLKKMADHLDTVLEITETRQGSYTNISPRPLASRRGPSKWVTRYVDYTSKYGLGFLLSNGSSGVYFNDSTKAVIEAHRDTFQYIERKKLDDDGTPRRGETVLETHSLNSYPEFLKKKVTLLKHFRDYLIEQQMKTDCDEENHFDGIGDIFAASELVYVKKWVRTKHAIMFFLSNKTVQVVFYDQTEVLFTPDIAFLTYVDKNRIRSTYSFTDELVGSLSEIEKRLKYTKEIMVQLLSGHRS
jgi:POLO box duplicated region